MTTSTQQPIYRRILLKLSGEVLRDGIDLGINVGMLTRLVQEIKELVQLGVQVGIVIGGGNLFRGSLLVKEGINRVVGDHIGMLSTVINGLAISNILRKFFIKTSIMSAIPLNELCDNYNYMKAIHLLHNNYVVVFVAGTGNPFFTTDSAACLRGIEIEAEVILKATSVDGVFSTDPAQSSNAILYDQLTYQDVLKNEFKVMDLAAFTLARDYDLPIRIFNVHKSKVLWRIVMGYKEGTLISK
ncbi:UMP kinase [Blochmannia endosymbiont of Colobopsis nipponica]|uniref:UMP kinase n=1 Tax=Blochmannia endosymbiont of Colobopsis nipponica TaxID=2681987 RepID=UPI00178059FA|nr:UMP kinase [Blochmannia endosymbiont of Colobopsis nipponica]QOI11308.1 UMP kinase [Blochmannia endosymbiont of Colobopsis nipponica]